MPKKNTRVITRREIKEAKEIVEDDLFKLLRDKLKKEYVFDPHIAGSAKYNLVVTNKNGQWDLDYQLYLSHNSKEEISNATRAKQRLGQLIYDIVGSSTSNGKTAITFNLGDINPEYNKISVDIVLMKNDLGYIQVMKRNPSTAHADTSHWTTWTARYQNADEKVSALSDNEKVELKNEVRRRKEIVRNQGIDKSGTDIFLEVLGDY